MLSKFSVKKPYTVVVAVVLVIILGVVSFLDMTVDLLPSMNLPYAVVMTTYVGASPEEVEEAVTRPIEQSMATISNISNISSTSQENASVVILEFEESANMDAVTVEMRESLDQISGYWPETVGNPMIMKLNPDMLPVMVAAVSIEGETAASASTIVEEEILPELESIEGVASVTTSGLVEETVEITVDPEKVAEWNEKVIASLDEKFDEAVKELEEAREEVENGIDELESSKETVADEFGDAEVEFINQEEEIENGILEIDETLAELEVSKTDLEEQLVEVKASEEDLLAQKETLETLKANEESTRQAYETVLATIAAVGETEELLTQKTTLEESIATLDNYDTLMGTIEESLSTITAGKKELESGITTIDETKTTLTETKEELEAGKTTIADARGEVTSTQIESILSMASAETQLLIGEQSLAEAEAEVENSKEEAYESADLREILTVEMVENILAAQNFNMPAGYVQEKGVDYLIRVGEKFENEQDIKNLVLMDIDGVDPIRLEDVAAVETVDDSSEVYTNVNGQPGVMLTFQKQTGYATGNVSDRVLDKFEEMSAQDTTIQFVTLMDQGVYIDFIVNSVLQNLLAGAVLAILILFIFLKNIRPTFVIACSIPISLMTAIVLMYFSGVTLNIISLSGLALGVGMLVDNAIVVIENIYRMRNEEGRSAKEAAIEGAREVSGAIMASTLTTVCVFAPIVFTEGITKQLFVDMGLTIAYSLLASLIVSLTVVPMMAAGLLRKTESKESNFFRKLKSAYQKLLRTALRRKGIVLVLALALFFGSAALSLSKGTEFMPSMESTQVTINLEMPEGTPLQETAEVSDAILDKVMEIPDVSDVGAMASSGSLFGGNTTTNKVEMYVILQEDMELTNAELKARIEADTADLPGEITVNTATMDMSALGSTGIVVEIKGRDLDTLRETASEVAGVLASVEGLTEVSDGMERTTGELRVIVNKTKASEYNLTVAQVYQEIAAQLAAASSSTTLAAAEKDYDVYVIDGETSDLTRKDIREMTITVTNAEGEEEELALSKIVSFEDTVGLQSISRDNQVRYINVSATLADGYNIGLVSADVKEALDEYKVPAGCSIEMAGEDETINEAMIELLKMLGLAIVFMYLIMVAQFQSLRSPFIIMFTIPLAFTGGFLGLWITNSPVSVIAMIGFIMLSGIIVNNGIVFVDYANQLIYNGMEKTEALVQAGKTRLRPILMTALTTILGLSTMAIGMGMGADMVQPMAIVTIGGLIYGTLLTLFVVPCIYALFHKKERAKLTEDINAL